MRPGRSGAGSGGKALGTIFDYGVVEARRRAGVNWTDPSGRPCRGIAIDYFVESSRYRFEIGVRTDNSSGLAAVALTALDAPIPGLDPSDRPIDLYYPARLEGYWQAPFVLRIPDPTGRVRRRFLSSPVDLKEMGLVTVLSELERWKLRLVPHEQAVDQPSKSLRGRLVALVPQTRPATLVAVYLATRIYPLTALLRTPSDTP